MDRKIFEIFKEMEQMENDLGLKNDIELKVFSHTQGYQIFQNLKFYVMIDQRKIVSKEEFNKDELLSLASELLSGNSNKDDNTKVFNNLVQILSKHIGVEAPNFKVTKGKQGILHTTKATVKPWEGCQDIFVRDNKSLNPSKKIYGQSVWQFFGTIYHELTHAKQMAEMKACFYGETVEEKYKLMFFQDIFTECNALIPKSFVKKLAKTAEVAFYDKEYVLSLLEVDARFESAKFLLGIEGALKDHKELNAAFQKYLGLKFCADADITEQTGTKMLNNLDKQKELFEKYYGDSELGKLVLEEYEKTRNSKEISQYEKEVNCVGYELTQIKKEKMEAKLGLKK